MSTDNKYLQFNATELHDALSSFLHETVAPLSEKYNIDLVHYVDLHMNGPEYVSLKKTMQTLSEKHGAVVDELMDEVAHAILENKTYQQIMDAEDKHKAEQEAHGYDKARCLSNKALHDHSLTYNGKLWNHYCNVCKKQPFNEAYRCNRCDFDCCVNCAQKTQ